MSIRRATLLAVFAAGLMGAALLAEARSEVDPEAPPELRAKAYFNAEKDPKLADLKGKKVVLVEFFATWCGPCRRSVPHLSELHEEHGGKLAIVALSNEDAKTIEDFVERNDIPYIVGAGSESVADYGVRFIPHAFLIGVDGKLAWDGNPLDPVMDREIEKALEEVE